MKWDLNSEVKYLYSKLLYTQKCLYSKTVFFKTGAKGFKGTGEAGLHQSRFGTGRKKQGQWCLPEGCVYEPNHHCCNIPI